MTGATHPSYTLGPGEGVYVKLTSFAFPYVQHLFPTFFECVAVCDIPPQSPAAAVRTHALKIDLDYISLLEPE
jgi:hypothetical protein